MPFSELEQQIVKTLLYYEIFDHPLSADELFCLLPKNSLSKDFFLQSLHGLSSQGKVVEWKSFYSLPGQAKNIADLRIERQRLAQQRLKIARFMSNIIRRFPFVRGIFLSGDLSKGVAHPDSDIDYVIITEPGRLWICRTFLMLFKKLFLLNNKKYFCLNYYVSTDNLQLGDRNYYTATEIAHLKPLYNFDLFMQYVDANDWIKSYFPNFKIFVSNPDWKNRSGSTIQKIVELLFPKTFADNLDSWLMLKMKNIWKKRYGQYDDAILEQIFRCTPNESRAYGGNFEGKI